MGDIWGRVSSVKGIAGAKVQRWRPGVLEQQGGDCHGWRGTVEGDEDREVMAEVRGGGRSCRALWATGRTSVFTLSEVGALRKF